MEVCRDLIRTHWNAFSNGYQWLSSYEIVKSLEEVNFGLLDKWTTDANE